LKRSTQIARLHRAAHWALEPLEDRLHMSATPYVTGGNQIAEDNSYRLNLISSGATFSYWSIDWGDGLNGNSDISITPESTTYMYHQYTRPGNFVVTTKAVDNLGNTLSTSTIGIEQAYGHNGLVQISQQALSALNGSNSSVESVATEPSGQVVVLSSTGVDLFNSDGSVDTSFGISGVAALPAPSNDPTATGVQYDCLGLDSNGDIAIGGISSNAFLIGEYTAAGKLSLSGALMSAAGPASAKAVQFQNNSIELVGSDQQGENVYWLENLTTYAQSFSVVGSNNGWNYSQAGVDASGSSWIVSQNGTQTILSNYSGMGAELSVSAPLSGMSTAMAVDASGDMFVAGEGISEFSPQGVLNTNFGSEGVASTPFQINELVALPNGQLLAGDVNGDVARFNADGTLDTTFGIGGVIDGELNSVAVNAGPNILQLANGDYETAAADANGDVNIERLSSGNNLISVNSGNSPLASLQPVVAATQGQSLTISGTAAAFNGTNPVFENWTVTDPNGNAYPLAGSGVTDSPEQTITPDLPGIWSVTMTVTDLTQSLTTTLAEQFNVTVPAQVDLPGLLPVVPSSNPVLPAGIDTFTPPISGTTASAGAPVIAASNLTAQPDQNISVTGSGIDGSSFQVYGQTNSTDALLSGATVQDASSFGDIVTINPSEPADAEYVLWPQSGGVVGNPIFINQPQTTWMSTTTPMVGQTVSIYGQNLSNGAATQQSWVYLQAPGGGGQWASVTSTSAYKVDFTIPTSIATGTYQVWINNGLGGQFSWSAPLTLTVQAATGWTGATINVTNFGATGNGSTDDGPAILKAIAQLQPGDTLYFPTGNYLIGNEQINIPQDVRVLGDGPSLSALNFSANLTTLSQETGFGPYAIGHQDGWTDHYLGASNEEFDSVALNYVGPSTSGELVRQRFGQNVTLNNVWLNARNLLDVDWLGSAQMSLTNSIVVGQGVQAFNVQNINVDSTVFKMSGAATAAVDIWNGHDISMTNCTAENYNDNSSDVNDWGQGRLLYGNLIWGSIYNEYAANNTTIDMGYPVPNNAGEEIAFEGTQDMYDGAPLSVTSTTVTIPLVTSTISTFTGLSVIVTDGNGIGQMRTVTSYTQGINSITLTLNSAWTVMPNNLGHIDVTTTAYNCVYADNTLQCQTGVNGANNLNAASGFQIWQGGYNMVFDGNTTDNLNSGVLLASNSVGNPCYFIEILNNNFENILQEGVGLQPQPMGLKTTDTDPNFIGVLIRNNTFSSAVATAQGIALVRAVPLGDQNIHLGTASLLVIEDNTMTNINTALSVNGANDPDVLVVDNSFSAGAFTGGTSVAVFFGAPAANSTTDVILMDDSFYGFAQLYTGTIPANLT
jgi:hypothetical protein